MINLHRKNRERFVPNADIRLIVAFDPFAIAGNISDLQQINISNGNLLSVEGSMIDAVLNVAVFATLVLCIVGFDAWARTST